VRSPLTFLRRRRRPDADFAAEIEAHLALETDRLIAEGLGPADAAWEARRRFGNVTLAVETYHRGRTAAWLEAVPGQLRLALRRLVRAPVFTGTATLTLLLGVGGTVAVFSLVDGVLIRPLPYAASGRLVDLSHTIVLQGLSRVDQSDATYLYYRRANHVFASVGAYRTVDVNLSDGRAGEPSRAQRVEASRASASVFAMLGIAPLRGRVFREGEDLPGTPPVVIVGERLWRTRYASDPGLPGRSVLIDGVLHEVVGVMPARFGFPDDGAALWLPVRIDPARTQSANFDLRGIARLKPGVSPDGAAADLQALLPHVPEAFPGRLTAGAITITRMRPVVRPLRDVMVGGMSRLLWVIFAAGAFLLLVACANVANLFLVRADERQHDLAVRRALGAGRGVIVAEFLAEGLLVSAAGGLLGLAASEGALGALRSTEAGAGIPRLAGIGLDGTVVAVTVGIILLAALATSLVPALRASRARAPAILLRSGRASTAGRGRQRARRTFVVVQLALGLVLVTGAGLMARTFRSLRSVPPGFVPAGALAFRVALPAEEYPGASDVAELVTQALGTVAAVPGVRAAGVVTKLPLDDEAREDTAIFVEDRPLAMGGMPDIDHVAWATPGAFAGLGIPFLQGRPFAGPDPARAPLEAVITRAVARRYWGDGIAVGKRIRFSQDGPWFTIVGVTGDVRDTRLDQPPAETVYLPLVTAPGPAAANGGAGDARWAPRELAFVVRTSGRADVMAQVERALHDVAPALPLYGARTMTDVVARSTARTSFTLELLEIAAALALLIGAVGLYGVVSYMVRLRARELAVRLSLGAEPRALQRLVLKQAAAVAAVGIALGLAAALVGTRFLAALLFGVAPDDPATLLGAAAVMAGVTAAASWWPARRAALTDPATVLRSDT
jgi:putative ABC transport system permease protein